MRINLTSVLVDDQDKALRFYTQVLGFQRKTEIPLGEHRWLTVVSPDDPDGIELVLEPDAHPAAKPFKEALAADGIPFTSFAVQDVRREFLRLQALGVEFTQEPAEMGPVTTAVFDDTCGNLIQIAQKAVRTRRRAGGMVRSTGPEQACRGRGAWHSGSRSSPTSAASILAGVRRRCTSGCTGAQPAG
jgi:catechol 2,3-dioxygenase-like lactoylglutathione lyase family enzyme